MGNAVWGRKKQIEQHAQCTLVKPMHSQEMAVLYVCNACRAARSHTSFSLNWRASLSASPFLHFSKCQVLTWWNHYQFVWWYSLHGCQQSLSAMNGWQFERDIKRGAAVGIGCPGHWGPNIFGNLGPQTLKWNDAILLKVKRQASSPSLPSLFSYNLSITVRSHFCKSIMDLRMVENSHSVGAPSDAGLWCQLTDLQQLEARFALKSHFFPPEAFLELL